jgi:hypothetical protein
MTLLVKKNESANPEDIGFFRFRAQMLLAADDTNLFQEFWFLRCCGVTP